MQTDWGWAELLAAGKSPCASQAIFEARNASVANSSAFSHTFHVTRDCAQSQDSVLRT